MTDGSPLRALLRRVRDGDQQAATELVRRFEPALRRAVRLRLRDPRLRRLFDSMDVCQSVLVRFFVSVRTGQHELITAEEVVKLLAAMARNYLVNLARHEQAAKRDHRRNGAADECEVAGGGSSPSQHAVTQELLHKTRQLLSADEWQLLELRKQSHEWIAIARMVGGNPEALRKQLARALARVAPALGLDEVLHV